MRVIAKPRSTSLAFLPYQLPTLTSTPPAGDGWLNEIKQDGYRTQLIVDDGNARAFSRSGYDWSKKYSGLVAAAVGLPVRSAIIDGEAVVQDEQGLSDFHALRAALSAEPHRITFYAFDLLHLDSVDFRRQPLIERRARLQELISGADPAIQFSESVEGDGLKVFRAAEKLGVEGIVSKRAQGRYEAGRSREWLKTKCMAENEFVVVGVEPNPGGPPFALLARDTKDGLEYAGGAFVTLKGQDREAFWSATDLLKTDRPSIPEIRRSRVSFLKPFLRVRAKYLRGEDMLRHASLVRLISG
jgi:DNA ligase D-like protein (predicted ligase)